MTKEELIRIEQNIYALQEYFLKSVNGDKYDTHTDEELLHICDEALDMLDDEYRNNLTCNCCGNDVELCERGTNELR